MSIKDKRGKNRHNPQKHPLEINKGSILVESLVAIALTAIFISSFASLSINAHRNTENALRSQQATFLGQEGIMAMNTINFQTLPLPSSAGVIAFTNNQWGFSSSSDPETFSNGMTRYIRILGVNRDGQCNIIDSGGIQDLDSREIQSEIQWQDATGRAHTAIFRQLRTQWENPTGSCFAPQNPMSSLVTINVSQAHVSSGEGHKLLNNITITNMSTEEEVAIDTMILVWNTVAEIEKIKIDTATVWSKNGPGTPLGPQASGTPLDILDEHIDANDTEEIDQVRFTQDMRGVTLTITLIFTDGSSITTDPFSP